MVTTSSRPPGPSPTLLVLRLAMTVAWAWIAITTFVGQRTPGLFGVALTLLGFATFLVALWINLHRAPRAHATTRTWALLAVQIVSGLALATDLMMLVALELPLVLKPRAATVTFGVLLAVVMAIGVALARTGQFVAAPELSATSPALQVPLTLGSIAGWQLLAFCGGLLASTEIRARRDVHRLMAELQIANRKIEESSREAERLHIARELHDAIGHRLAALGVNLDLESRRADGPPAAALREARDATQQLLAEVRGVVGALRQEGPLDLKRSIAALVSGLGTLEMDLAVSPGLDVRDTAIAHTLYRCAQEALTNVLRHSQATGARVELRQDTSGVTLIVRDNGDGAQTLREGHGISGMRERLEGVGGTLRVTTRPGAGFEIVAWVPLEDVTP